MLPLEAAASLPFRKRIMHSGPPISRGYGVDGAAEMWRRTARAHSPPHFRPRSICSGIEMTGESSPHHAPSVRLLAGGTCPWWHRSPSWSFAVSCHQHDPSLAGVFPHSSS